MSATVLMMRPRAQSPAIQKAWLALRDQIVEIATEPYYWGDWTEEWVHTGLGQEPLDLDRAREALEMMRDVAHRALLLTTTPVEPPKGAA